VGKSVFRKRRESLQADGPNEKEHISRRRKYCREERKHVHLRNGRGRSSFPFSRKKEAFFREDPLSVVGGGGNSSAVTKGKEGKKSSRQKEEGLRLASEGEGIPTYIISPGKRREGGADRQPGSKGISGKKKVWVRGSAKDKEGKKKTRFPGGDFLLVYLAKGGGYSASWEEERFKTNPGRLRGEILTRGGTHRG